jgi:serine/threonine protein kinase
MNVFASLSSLALKGATQAAGIEAVGGGVEAVVGLLRQRFSDNSKRLSRALERSSKRAWRAVELALAGSSWWDRARLALSSAEQRAFRQQVQAFLQAHPLDNLDGHGPDFRGQALAQLQAARKAGLLTHDRVDPDDLARRVGNLARFGDRPAAVEAEYAALGEIVAGLRGRGYEALAAFRDLRPASGPPVLLSAMRYFFQRELENDRELFQGLAYARLESLAEDQSAGFASLAEALDEHGDRLEALLSDVQAVVVQTHGDVLDIKAELARQGQQMQELGQAVLAALQQHQLERRELHGGDSLSVRDEGERRLVKDLVRRYRALPAEQRRHMPALLNAVGKLEVVAGDFESAQHDFRELATLVAEPSGRAEAAHNAYRAALEQRAWGEALSSLKEAVALDAARFAPFPIDKFEPEKILGAGGFGVAFLCRNRHSGAHVVIKTLRRDGLDRDLGDVFREAQTLEALEHPAIIRVRDCDYADAAHTRPFLVMDYFPGQNLAEHVERHGPLPVREWLPLARLVAEGLQRAHARGILHRDVKPANLLVGQAASLSPGERQAGSLSHAVKVIDFGLALRAASTGSTMRSSLDRTLAGSSIAGTIEYAAPEQMGKLKGVAVGTWSDVYGFGKTCCFALFGTAQPTFQHWQQLPRPLADLLGRCLAEQPSQRPQDFTAVLAELDRLLAPRPDTVPIAALPEAVPVPVARPVEQRRGPGGVADEDAPEVPVPVARAVEPRRPEPRRAEPRPRPRPHLDDLEEVQPVPAPRKRSVGVVFFVLLGVVVVAGAGLVGGSFLLLNQRPRSTTWQSSATQSPFPGLGGPVRPAPVKYDPIKEEEFPGMLHELQMAEATLARKRDIAGRLGETEPTAKQATRHSEAQAHRKAWDAGKPLGTKIALDHAEQIDDVQHVSAALDPLLKETDLEVRKAVTKALTRWGTKKNVEGLIPLTEASGFGADVVRANACVALGHIRDLRGIVPVLKRLDDIWDGGHFKTELTGALISFGPPAEEAVLSRLRQRGEAEVRRQAVAILERIGTEKSLTELKPYENDRLIGPDVKRAMETIRARGTEKDKDGKNEVEK